MSIKEHTRNLTGCEFTFSGSHFKARACLVERLDTSTYLAEIAFSTSVGTTQSTQIVNLGRMARECWQLVSAPPEGGDR